MVGQVEWLTVEHSAFPKRRGMQDFGLIDLPYPLRKMSLNPLGTLRKRRTDSTEEKYSFRRGAEAFPSIGDGVFLPTEIQLRSIVESGDNRWVKIGTSPLAGNAEVRIDPDRLFGRHLAVLGNTGSGKSCSVAGLIRWSLEASQADCKHGSSSNARFIILDPNGEYSRAFIKDTGALKPRIFQVTSETTANSLQVPLWFWNSAEWCSFTQASGKSQRPLLKRALREVKAGRRDMEDTSEEERRLSLRRYLSSILISISKDFKSGAIKTEESKFGFRLKAIELDLEKKRTEFTDYQADIDQIRLKIKETTDATFKTFLAKDGKLVEYFKAFTEQQVTNITESFQTLLGKMGGIIYQEGPSEDVPLGFSGGDFADHLQLLSEQEGVSQYLDFLVMRIRTMLSDTRMKSVIGDSGEIYLEQWLNNYIGADKAENGCLTIIDLSLVPTEIIHIVNAVIARIIFEALQRYRKLNQKALPTVLVMEEAHMFIKRYKDDTDNHDAAAVCCQVFERIAREGRKFGLGLVLSSQRPSELSPTVLSQCNTFLLHRISNDRDQELVQKLVPDNLKGLLRELPSLPSQNAVLLGWASELPLLVKMTDLPEEQQPQSDDPDFWDVWTGKKERPISWKTIADEWQDVVQDTVPPPPPPPPGEATG